MSFLTTARTIKPPRKPFPPTLAAEKITCTKKKERENRGVSTRVHEEKKLGFSGRFPIKAKRGRNLQGRPASRNGLPKEMCRTAAKGFRKGDRQRGRPMA